VFLNIMAKQKIQAPKDKLLPRLTVLFFDRARTTALLWVALAIFGTVSYTTLLRREGFPSINIPLTFVGGTYFVNDPAKVDADVAKPLTDIALKQEGVSNVQSQSADNFFTVSIQYEEGVDAKAAAAQLQKTVADSGKLPKTAQAQYNVPYFGATGGDVQQIDAAVSFYGHDNKASASELAAKAQAAANYLNQHKPSRVKEFFVKSPFKNVTNPVTGQAVTVQQSFDRFGKREDGRTSFHNSVIIGVTAAPGVDVIKLDKQVHDALHQLHEQPDFKDYHTEISASFAPSIEENLGELQRVLLEGLLAILVVGSLVIAIRASLITVVSMVTVLVSTLGFLYAFGYTLNVITLFALILGLALIVDDTIIMVEAIDAARRRHKDRREVVKEATRRVSRAMVAATATASLSFAPLLFVGGILGSFIRAIPITIIASLVISLLVALIFIPFFSRFVLLGKKQMGKNGVKEISAGLESRVASIIAAPMLWARDSKKRLFSVGIAATMVGVSFIIAGLVIAKGVVFNIFPPAKDTNGIVLSMNFPPGTPVQKAESIADNADKLAASVIGEDFEQSSYYATGNAQTATEQIQITSYSKRDIASPQIVKQLQTKFNTEFKDAKVVVGQMDLGPPTATFTTQIDASNRQAALRAGQDLANFMSTAELKRTSGKTAHFTNVSVSNAGQYIRAKGKPIITVSASFDGDDTSTLVTLGQNAVKEKFNTDALRRYGLGENALSFDIGQESENQDSFKTLALAFPVLLAVMYVLLALEFRSLLQPLLIFMAIPFSIFGIMLGLRLTNNPISFFGMLGFFALIGLSIKNTILLTDFANQSRRSGLSAVDSAHAALEERFRPLFATSMTAVVSLIPLAVSSPFWQGLAVVLIFGLLSSTFLVVTVFPYYYLGAEYLRLHIGRRHFFTWLAVTVALVFLAVKTTSPAYALSIPPATLLFVAMLAFHKRRLRRG
jgi:multidrug efflux pump subunit AcrB